MTDLTRLYQIANTGQLTDPNTQPTNLMSQVPQQQSFWDKTKAFAKTNLGRNLLGGLGTGLAVALAGGDTRDAIGYGVIGAGNTAKTIYDQQQDAKAWKDRELQRNLYWQNAEANRKQSQDLFDKRLQGEKELADLRFQNALKELDYQNQLLAGAEDAEFQRKIDRINANPYLNEDQKKWQIAQLGATFDRDAYYSDKLTSNPQDTEALSYFNNKNLLNGLINPLTPQDRLKLGGELAKSAGLSLDPAALNQGQISFVNKAEKPSEFSEKITFLTKAGYTPEQIVNSLGLGGTEAENAQYAYQKSVDLQNSLALANANAKNAENLEGAKFQLQQQGADAQLQRDIRLAEFKSGLPTDTQRNISAQAQAMGLPESAIYQAMYDEQQAKVRQAIANIENTQAGTNKINTETRFIAPQAEADLANTQASTRKINTEIPYIGQQAQASLAKTIADIENTKASTAKTQQELANLQDPNYELNKAMATQKAKDQAEVEKAQRQVEEMWPRVMQAINRAYDSIKDGEGLGQLGGMFWTTEKGGINRANVQNAQAQINTLMRGILSTMGVGATEMNSAAEAAAYRYMIDPSMQESQIKQVLDNFVADYNSGALMNNLQTVANSYQGNGFKIERVE